MPVDGSTVQLSDPLDEIPLDAVVSNRDASTLHTTPSVPLLVLVVMMVLLLLLVLALSLSM